jgi:dipeptidyl aminopeptidase/acylaminoacyl peptidase
MEIRIRQLLLAACGAVWIVTHAQAQQAAYGTAAGSDSLGGVLTPDQTLQRWQLGDLQISPDARRIALVVTAPVQGTKRSRHVWVHDVVTRQVRQFTASDEEEFAPRWSPNGNALAFLSNRSETTQIYLLWLEGGEGQALTESKSDIQSYAWSPNGKQLAYLAAEPQADEVRQRQEDKDDARVVDHDDRHPQLWLIDIESKQVRQLTASPWRISEFAWVPPGDRLLVSASDQPQPELLTDRLYMLDLKTAVLQLFAEPTRPYGNLKISPDGGSVAYSGTRSDGPTPHDLYVLPLSSGSPRNLTSPSIDRSIDDFQWRDDGNLTVLVAAGFTSRFHTLTKDGQAKAHAATEVNPSGAFAAGSGMLAFVGETTSRAPELWVSTANSQARQVTKFNAAWDSISAVPLETIRYTSFDGKQIEAGLLLPADYEKEKRIPMVALVHGGPAERWADAFDSWGQLLAARGYAVLYPNIRGSTGYGHEFLALNKADWGGGDFKDLMAGVDYVIEEGIADPDLLGIGGWSYGGYMAAWAVTQTDRFKAAVSGAPMTDLASEYGTEEAAINPYDTWFLGTPYENLQLFIERSPVTYVGRVTTPTIILCGENDVTDPIGQCQQFYRGLKRHDVETELVIYPREGHRIREEKHQIDLLQRMLDWFETHLKQDDPLGQKPAGTLDRHPPASINDLAGAHVNAPVTAGFRFP